MTKFSKKEKIDQDPDFLKFQKNVPASSDPINMILRCHLLAEVYLDKVILFSITRGDIIVDSRFQFSEKLTIVEALDIFSKDVIDSLKRLNSIRNSCSHELDYRISEREVDKIGAPLGNTYFQDLKEHFSNNKKLLYFTLLTLMARMTGKVKRILDEKGKNTQKQTTQLKK
jgi:hypothetical protein